MTPRLHIFTLRHPLVAGAVLFTIVVAGSGGLAMAAPGGLDRSFGDGGKVVKNLAEDDQAVAVDTYGGHTFTVGDTASGKVIVADFKPDGRLDRSFGFHGTKAIPFSGTAYAADIAVQPNGKVLVAAQVYTSPVDDPFGVARLSSDGSLDRSFDRNGMQTTGFGPEFGDAHAHSLALQPDGRIVIAGYVYPEASYSPQLAVVRYRKDGSLDPSFSGDGRLESNLAATTSEYGNAVALDGDGRIVVAGEGRTSSYTSRLVLARYDASGQLDPSFSDDGYLTSSVAREAEDVATLSGDQVVVVGSAADDFMIARFTEDGTPDATFAGDGVQSVDFADSRDVATSVVSNDRKLLVAGSAETGVFGANFAVVRLGSSGRLDRRFSRDGRAMADLSRHDDYAYDLAVNRRGRIVAAGSAWHRQGTIDDDTDTGLIRLLGGSG